MINLVYETYISYVQEKLLLIQITKPIAMSQM